MAVSFCCPEETKFLRAIERLTRLRIDAATDMPELTLDVNGPEYKSNGAKPGDFRRRKPAAGGARRNGSGRPGKPKAGRNAPRGDAPQAAHAHGSCKRDNHSARPAARMEFTWSGS